MRKLKELDKKILGLLETWGALGLGQLMGSLGTGGRKSGTLVELLFNESFLYEGKVYLHLRKLQRRGLIRSYRSIHKLVYGLTRKGHAELVRLGLHRMPSCAKEIRSSSVEHRLLCSAVGLTARHVWGRRVLSEREAYFNLLWNSGGRRPAGYRLPDLIIEHDGLQIPVEIELFQKSSKRYARIWRFYLRKLGPEGRVLYVVPGAQRAEGLVRAAGAMGIRLVFACGLPAFRAASGRPVFRNFRGQEYIPQ